MSDDSYKLLLIDEDPVFRLGLRTLLAQFSDLMVIAEADNSDIALRILDGTESVGETPDDRPPLGENNPVETSPTPTQISSSDSSRQNSSQQGLVILDVTLRQSAPNTMDGLALCQTLTHRYPHIAVLILSATQDLGLLASARTIGIAGYCPKGADIADIVSAIRQVATGQTYGWQDVSLPTTPTATPAPATPTPVPSTSNQELSESRLPNPDQPGGGNRRPTPFNRLLGYWHQSGLQQIDDLILAITDELQHRDLLWLEREVLAGRRRELRAARWLVNLLPAANQTAIPMATGPSGRSTAAINRPQTTRREAVLDASLVADSNPGSPEGDTIPTLSKLNRSEDDKRHLRSALFDAVAQQMQSSLTNLTGMPLEIDILHPEAKRQLLYLVLRKLEQVLDDLSFSQIEPDQVALRRDQILHDLWQAVMADFFGKYRTVDLGNRSYPMLETLLEEGDMVKVSILDKLPQVEPLLSHLLFLSPILVDQAIYNAGSSEAMTRAGLLLNHLVINVANAVIQPLLNRFANVELVKQTFYDRRLLSTREIERFRNDLSWKYRVQRYIDEPVAIFQSQFSLLLLGERGIKKTTIYGDRDYELSSLQGIPAAVTFSLELRDAVAPRLRSAIALVGSGVVYLLTEVLGRGIGLIGRGVIKGIGNALQDTKARER